jgi:hypothetical protein
MYMSRICMFHHFQYPAFQLLQLGRPSPISWRATRFMCLLFCLFWDAVVIESVTAEWQSRPIEHRHSAFIVSLNASRLNLIR